MVAAPLFVLALLQAAASPNDPRESVRAAFGAVEGDSAPAVRVRWESRAREQPADRPVRLALATLYRLIYDYPAADRHYRHLRVGPIDRFALYAMLGEAEADRLHRSLDSAAHRFSRAAAVASQFGDRAAQADALIGLALATSRIAPLDSSLDILRRAAREVPRDEQGLEAKLRCTRGRLLLSAGHSGGKREADAGLALARRLGDPRLQALCWQAIGVWAYNTVDDPARSGLPLDSAERYQRMAHDHAGLAETLGASGLDRHSYLDHVLARRKFLLAISEARTAGHLFAETAALQGLAAQSVRTGSFVAAARDLRAAMALAAAGGDRPALMRATASLAGIDFSLGRFTEAKRGYRVALEAADRLVDPTAGYLYRHALALAAGVGGDWPRADTAMQAVLGYMKAHGLSGWIPGMRYGEGLIALKAGAIDRAERILQAYLTDTSPAEYVLRYQARSRLAEVYFRRGQVERSIGELTAASDHLDSMRMQLDDEHLRTLAFQTSGGKLEEPDYGFAGLIAGFVRAGHEAAAFHLAERRRARDLIDQILRATARASDSAEAGSLVHQYLARDAIGPVEDSTALVEYVAGRWGQPTTVFVLTRGRLTAHVLPSMDSLGPRVERLLAMIVSGADDRALGARVRADLLDQVLERLPDGIRRILIVPDDVLHRLPFDALRFDDGRPLLTRYAVGIAPSVAVAASLRSRPRREGAASVLAFGDPAFAHDTSSGPQSEHETAFEESGGLDRIPYSGAEARLAGAYGVGSIIRIGIDASEAALKEGLQRNIAVLHLATHAIVDDWTVARTALALAPGDNEDGFLSSREILTLGISAELVVLSACRTAAGPVVSGEGVQGLTGPLLAAGARAVVATHWPILDRGTLSFVRSFYRSLAAGQPVVEALREAKLDAIARGRPAREWAAFTLVGDPMLRLGLEAPADHRLRWAVAIGTMLVALGAFMARHRGMGRATG
jgi:tetratricopeptide (TPR) repeat protein